MASTVAEFTKTHPVFTSTELQEQCGSTQNTRNLLHNAIASGRAYKVRRNLYVSNAGRFEGTHPPYQLIAAKTAPDATLCYATAFSLFLGNQDILSEAQFYTAVQMKPFQFDGVRFVPYSPPHVPPEVKAYRLANGSRVMGTTKEQTVVDSIAHIVRAGGVEAVLRNLSALRFLDTCKVTDLALASGPTVCARIGWVLERKAEEWNVSDSLLETLSKKTKGGPYYLGPVSAKVQFIGKWHLYLPEESRMLKEWING